MTLSRNTPRTRGTVRSRALAAAIVLLPQLALAQTTTQPTSPSTGTPAASPAIDAAIRARQAVAALRSDRPEDAIRLYTAALAAEGLANDQRALMLIDRGVARARLGQSRAALDDFNRAIQLVPEGATAYNNRGTVLIELGAATEAVRDFDRAILLAPNYAAALTNRAATHVRLGNLRAALGDYSRAIGLLQADSGAFAGRGRVHLAQNRPYAALRDFGRALGVSPRFGPALRARAEARLALERYKDAIDDLGRVLDIDHDNIEVLLLRGYAAVAAREIATALTDFERAVALDPRSNAALEARGFAQAKDAKYDDALNDLSQAIELEPRSAQAYAYRGWVYKLTGRAELGQKDIERAMGLEPDRPEVIWARGELLEALGRPDEAIVELRRALEMKPMLREAAAALERNGASTIFASHELDDQGVGDWRIQVRGSQYFAINSQYPRLTVPLEMMGDGQPRLLEWTQRTEATQHIGILRFTAGTVDGASGPEAVEHAAVIDTRARTVVTVELVKQGAREATWTWSETRLTVAGLDGGSEEYILVAPVEREVAQPRRPLDAPGPRYGGGNQVPSWAPWAQGSDTYAPPSRKTGSRSTGSSGPKPKTLFDLLFKN
jgi:tetratricopeptide (TPR) repeat protein